MNLRRKIRNTTKVERKLLLKTGLVRFESLHAYETGFPLLSETFVCWRL